MLTFDEQFPSKSAEQLEFESLLKHGVTLPDVVECGENNAVWFRVVRSKKTLELISKQTGLVTTRCKIEELLDPSCYGMSPQQWGAVKAALRLGTPP
jgi:hypothetical protein